MTAKEFLQQAYYAHQEVDIKLEQIARLQALATRTTTTMKEIHGEKSVASVVEKAIIAMEEKAIRLADEIKKLIEVNEKITAMIGQVKNPQERIILKYRYLCFLPWATISFLLHASERKVFLLHNQALKNFPAVLQ